MNVSSVSPYAGYRVLGVYGNPGSVRPIQKVSEESQKKSPLVTVTKEQDEQIAAQSTLPATKSLAVNGFADTLKMEELQTSDAIEGAEMDAEFTSTINDTIGVMGYQNSLRMQLTGSQFQAF